MTYGNQYLTEKCKEILDKFTIDPDTVLPSGQTAAKKLAGYIEAGLDRIERDMEEPGGREAWNSGGRIGSTEE